LWTAGSSERTVIWSFTWSGMMFDALPPWMLPTVTTAGSTGLFSRDTMVCRPSTMRAAITTGSIALCGNAPWPPLPYTVMSRPVELARK
jgi:hypothetical protein